jgi:hypothetical protein
MQSYAQLKLEELNETRHREMRRAHDERLVGGAGRSLRLRVGGSVARFGARVAGEPRLAWPAPATTRA